MIFWEHIPAKESQLLGSVIGHDVYSNSSFHEIVSWEVSPLCLNSGYQCVIVHEWKDIASFVMFCFLFFLNLPS